MTTPWISRPRWTCKYCNVTINDDVPSRSSHENGLRHKSNVERSLREAYRKSQRERADEAQAKRELEKIERLAREAHAHDDDAVRSSSSYRADSQQLVTSSSSSSKTEGKPSKWKPSDRFAAYGSALPTTFEEGRVREAEKRVQERQAKEDLRREEGVAGEWQVVEPSTKEVRTPQEQSSSSSREKNPSSFSVREKKGEYKSNVDANDEVDIVVKKRNRVATTETERKQERQQREREMVPTWQPLRLDTGVSVKDEGVQAVPISRSFDDQQSSVQLDEVEDKAKEVKKEEHSPPEASASASSSIFKKRKTNAGAGAKKVRAVI